MPVTPFVVTLPLMDLSAPTVIVPDPVAALSTAGTSSLPVSVTVESPANARLAVSATSAASAACTVFMIQLLCGCGRMLAEALVRFEAISGVRRRDDEARRGRIGFDFLAQSIDELLEHALLAGRSLSPQMGEQSRNRHGASGRAQQQVDRGKLQRRQAQRLR